VVAGTGPPANPTYRSLFVPWAARYTGQPGRPPADLDVLVLGTPDRDDLDDAAQRASPRLAREVNITLRSPTWWEQSTDGFHTEITTRPLVTVLPQEPRREIITSGKVVP
jgi:hypothetical protein